MLAWAIIYCFIISIAQQVFMTEAVCCRKYLEHCKDGYHTGFFGCCGHGACNIFCCNCDGGCREQPPPPSCSLATTEMTQVKLPKCIEQSDEAVKGLQILSYAVSVVSPVGAYVGATLGIVSLLLPSSENTCFQEMVRYVNDAIYDVVYTNNIQQLTHALIGITDNLSDLKMHARVVNAQCKNAQTEQCSRAKSMYFMRMQTLYDAITNKRSYFITTEEGIYMMKNIGEIQMLVADEIVRLSPDSVQRDTFSMHLFNDSTYYYNELTPKIMNLIDSSGANFYQRRVAMFKYMINWFDKLAQIKLNNPYAKFEISHFASHLQHNDQVAFRINDGKVKWMSCLKASDKGEACRYGKCSSVGVPYNSIGSGICNCNGEWFFIKKESKHGNIKSGDRIQLLYDGKGDERQYVYTRDTEKTDTHERHCIQNSFLRECGQIFSKEKGESLVASSEKTFDIHVDNNNNQCQVFTIHAYDVTTGNVKRDGDHIYDRDFISLYQNGECMLQATVFKLGCTWRGIHHQNNM